MEKVNEKNEIALVLEDVKLKDFEKGEGGQVVRLVDIERTRMILMDAAKKFKGLKIDENNYRKEGAEAESLLRNYRYELQRVHKSNNKILNKVKSSEKEMYEGLISITEPLEKRLNSEISEIRDSIKKEKEEKERVEKERIKKIEVELEGISLSLDKIIAVGRVDEDVIKYDRILSDLESSFLGYEEFQFKAERIHAVYCTRKAELIEQVNKFKREEEESERLKARVKEEKKNRDTVYRFRKDQLLSMGFKDREGSLVFDGEVLIGNDDIKSISELGWFEKVKGINEHISQSNKREEDRDKEDMKKIVNDWGELVVVFEGFGGSSKKYRLSEGEIPTKEKFEEIVKDTKKIQDKSRRLKIKGVKAEIEPFKEMVLGLVSEIDRKIKVTDFNHRESKEIMMSLIKGFESSINEIVGEVINS